MIIDLRLDGGNPRGAKEAAEAVGSVMRAAQAGQLDLSAARAVTDWVQYRRNFRAPVAARRVLPEEGVEVAFDLARLDADTLDEQLRVALENPDATGSALLEDWTRLSESVIWRFNNLYWGELALWEEAAGHGYAQALPGGENAAIKSESARSLILELFHSFDALAERHALPERLPVLEIGVGSGDQARVWLDEFQRLDAEMGRDYYRKLQYLMGDYSSHVLDTARETVGPHRAHVSTLVVDASRPRDSLRFLDGGLFLIYISNVYDNLPTDELAIIADVLYQVEVRAHLPRTDLERIAVALGVDDAAAERLASRLVSLGPRLLAETEGATFADAGAATAFWQEVWGAIRLAERYRPLGPLDRYEICDTLTGELLAPMLAGHGDVRFHVSNGAVSSFLDTLPLLHPYGLLTCHDLFVTDLEQYRRGFRGPGKYDGSVVNWVNGPVLKASASRRGYHVSFQPFSLGSRSPITTAIARARE